MSQIADFAAETGQVVAEESQLDLDRTYLGRGVLGEDVEDQRLPVDHVAVEDLLEIALLGRRQRLVEHDNVDVEGGCQGRQLFGFPRTYERSRIYLVSLDQLLVDGLGACRFGQQSQLVQ